MSNFPFPPTQPDTQSDPGVSQKLFDFGTVFGDKTVTMPNRKIESISNIIINLAIPFPLETVIDDLKRNILKQAVNSEMVSLRVEVLGLYIDTAAIQLHARIPSYLCVDRVIRAIQTRAAYAWLICTHEQLFFSGLSIVSTQQISPADISELVS